MSGGTALAVAMTAVAGLAGSVQSRSVSRLALLALGAALSLKR